MKLETIKLTVAAVYVVAIAGAGLISGMTSAVAWVGLGGLAVLPVAAMFRLWRHPSATMSESIQSARR